MNRLSIAVMFVVCAAPLIGDQLTLKNQDRITGKVVKKEGDKLTFKTESFGEITVPWEHVQDLRTDEPVNVVLASGVSTETILNTSDPATNAPLQLIEALRDSAEQLAWEGLQHPSWLQLWAGTAAIGWAGAEGNAETRIFTAAANATRATRTDKSTIYFAAIRSSASVSGINAETAQAVRGGWSYDRNVSRRIFLSGFNDYEYDRFQNLDLRFVLGGGLGFIAWQTERGRLDLLTGVAYNRESFASRPPEPAFTRNAAEAYVGDQFTYAVSTATTLIQSFRYFSKVDEAGRYRMNFDLTANTRVFRWLSWNIALSDRFLSSPVAGREKNDLLYSTGIGINFAR